MSGRECFFNILFIKHSQKSETAQTYSEAETQKARESFHCLWRLSWVLIFAVKKFTSEKRYWYYLRNSCHNGPVTIRDFIFSGIVIFSSYLSHCMLKKLCPVFKFASYKNAKMHKEQNKEEICNNDINAPCIHISQSYNGKLQWSKYDDELFKDATLGH